MLDKPARGVPSLGLQPFSGSGGVSNSVRADTQKPSRRFAMPDRPQPPANDRFKAEMPQIPGVAGATARAGSGGGPWLVVGGVVAVLLAVLVGGRLLSKSHRAESESGTAQIDVPTAAPELPVPAAKEGEPTIAHVGELANPWDSRLFSFRNRSGENVSALLLRLPGGSSAQSSSYWAVAMRSAYGNCQLEYVQDLDKLKAGYGYRQARHPMVGNPCSRSLYDPLKYASLPGNVLVRGAIAQGSDLRPPLGIEVKIRGKDIIATRME